MIQKNPTFTPDQVKALLMKTAYKSLPQYSTVIDAGVTYTIQYDAFTVGAGYLDLQAAISSTRRSSNNSKRSISDRNIRRNLRLRLFRAE